MGKNTIHSFLLTTTNFLKLIIILLAVLGDNVQIYLEESMYAYFSFFNQNLKD